MSKVILFFNYKEDSPICKVNSEGQIVDIKSPGKVVFLHSGYKRFYTAPGPTCAVGEIIHQEEKSADFFISNKSYQLHDGSYSAIFGYSIAKYLSDEEKLLSKVCSNEIRYSTKKKNFVNLKLNLEEVIKEVVANKNINPKSKARTLEFFSLAIEKSRIFSSKKYELKELLKKLTK